MPREPFAPRYKPRPANPPDVEEPANQNKLDIYTILLAASNLTPPTLGRPASHDEAMKHLREVLLPALQAIVRRLENQDPKVAPLTDEERQSASKIWQAVSQTVKERRPRPSDIPLNAVSNLIYRSRAISPQELHTWKGSRPPK